MRMKEESEKAVLKLSIQKPKIMASGPINSWQICVCWVMSDCNCMNCSPPGFSVHGISQERMLDCCFLLQGIFLTQGLNPCLLHTLHWQADSLPTGLPGKPNRRGKSERFYFLGLQNHCDDYCSHEIKGHLFLGRKVLTKSFPSRSVGKDSACSSGDLDSIPGSGRSPGEGTGNSLQYCCL